MRSGINRVSTGAILSSNIVSFPLTKQQPRSAPNKVALTEQRVADLKAVGSTIYVHDARMPGLSVRVTKAGVKSYVFTKKVNGRFLRITLGKTASMTLSAARSAASAHHGDIAKGVDIAAVRRSAKAAASVKTTTLADAYERFLTLKDRRSSTTDDYKRLWRLHLPDHLKRKPLADVTPSDVEKLKARTRQQDAAHREQGHRLALSYHVKERPMGRQSGAWRRTL